MFEGRMKVFVCEWCEWMIKYKRVREYSMVGERKKWLKEGRIVRKKYIRWVF